MATTLACDNATVLMPRGRHAHTVSWRVDAGPTGTSPDAPADQFTYVAPPPTGYWEVASDGGIFAFGDAGYHGSTGGKPLNAPIAGMGSTPDGGGYWFVASDGGVFTFGDAIFSGSATQYGVRNIVGLAPNAS